MWVLQADRMADLVQGDGLIIGLNPGSQFLGYFQVRWSFAYSSRARAREIGTAHLRGPLVNNNCSSDRVCSKCR